MQSWLNPGADAQGSGYQARQARFALANGGVFGDGLGQGTAKWNYLPNAHNDFIFAIIGEELGFVGAVGLLCLFGLFAYTGMRIARRSADPFLRLLTATATLWVIGQVFINVGYVVGLLPVTGLQLPLISAGGTSTATTLLMIGMMANAARHEPEAVAALRAGRDDTGEPAAAAAAARAVRADPHGGAARPAAVTPGPSAEATPSTKPAKKKARAADRRGAPVRDSAGRQRTRCGAGRCVGQGIMDAGQRKHGPIGLAHWKVSVTGEQGVGTRGRSEAEESGDLGRSRRRRHRGPRRTRDGRRRRADRARPGRADHRAGHCSAVWRPGWCPNAATTSS